jgi:hypothetical protein
MKTDARRRHDRCRCKRDFGTSWCGSSTIRLPQPRVDAKGVRMTAIGATRTYRHVHYSAALGVNQRFTFRPTADGALEIELVGQLARSIRERDGRAWFSCTTHIGSLR